MTNFTITPEEIDIEDSEELLMTYQFGSQTATHYFCSRCGIFTFVLTRLNPGEYRVNLGCLDGINSNTISTYVYDGENL